MDDTAAPRRTLATNGPGRSRATQYDADDRDAPREALYALAVVTEWTAKFATPQWFSPRMMR